MPRLSRRSRERIIVSGIVGIGLVLIGAGLLGARTGDSSVRKPSVVEEVVPLPDDDQAPSQTEVAADLAPGYEAVLVIDGIELPTTPLDEVQGVSGAQPGQQIALPPTAIFDPGNYRISFRPSSGAPIEEFTQGRHSATVVYWKLEEGRARSRSFTWGFQVL